MTPDAAVRKGLQKIGVIGAGQPVSGESLSDGFDLLNQMLHSWELESVDLAHYDAKSGDELPFPQNHDAAIIYNFAVWAAPEYEVQPSQVIVSIADRELHKLRNAYLDPNMRLSVDKALLPTYNANDETLI